jgi:predicted membrane-bound spermidine synthase
MAGNGLGNWLAVSFRSRIVRPERWFVSIHLLIGFSGILLAILLPRISGILVPFFQPLMPNPVLLHSLRFFLAFILLLFPATAMGMTLPLGMTFFSRSQDQFSSSLGKLYGINTLGGVIGALIGELWLFQAFGILGTTFFAGGINLSIGLSALWISPSATKLITAEPPASGKASGNKGEVAVLCLITFVAGGTLLALEVVWFRFLQLFIPGGSLGFSVMLATVLLGIALGGFGYSIFLAHRTDPRFWIAILFFSTCFLTIQTYESFQHILPGHSQASLKEFLPIVRASVALMLAVCCLSGILFPLVGKALRSHLGDHVQTTGILTGANTLGAMLGPLLARFFLLPTVGMECSFLVLSQAYFVAGLLMVVPDFLSRSRSRRLILLGFGLLAIGRMALFPWDLLQERYLQVPLRRFMNPYMGIAVRDGGKTDARVIAIKEGLVDTNVYLEYSMFSKPWWHKLVTNSFSMSGTGLLAKRYMRMFAYLPVSLHPSPKKALLVCYGVGLTAKALMDCPDVSEIRIVDISPDVLEMSRLLFPASETCPMDDPRVKVQIEDGRFFLQVTPEKFDVITAEPPPPKLAGMTNLFSREYFRLIHDRLNDGGYVSYWLPMHNLYPDDARAIIQAFLAVFPNATLWNGAGKDWILLGGKSPLRPVQEKRFARLWESSAARESLREIGFEHPAQLAATFLAGPEKLAECIGTVLPLEDDYPYRLSRKFGSGMDQSLKDLENPDLALIRFRESRFIRELFPASLREMAERFFPFQRFSVLVGSRQSWEQVLPEMFSLLTKTELKVIPLILMEADPYLLKIMDNPPPPDKNDPFYRYLCGARALVNRDYGPAAALFPDSDSGGRELEESIFRRSIGLKALALILSAQPDGAKRLLNGPEAMVLTAEGKEFLETLLVP